MNTNINTTTLNLPACDLIVKIEYNVITASLCAVLALFGLVYTYFGYRCFKAVMFLSGLIFGGITAYLLCREERIFQQTVSLEIAAGISAGIGVLCGLITLLVRYVGLFLQGFFLGLLLAFAGILALQSVYHPSTAWIPAGILFGTGVLCSLLTLKFQKRMIIFSTSVFGSILITACVDYFLEDFFLMRYAWEALMAMPNQNVCWYTWLILSIWPTLSVTGILLQWKVTGKGYDHTDVIIPRGRRKQVRTHLVRIHRGPQEGNMRQRPPPTTSRNANPPTAASRSSRRPEQRQSAVPQPPAGSNNPPVDVRQMRVEIDPDEPPPSYFECVELGVGEPVRRSDRSQPNVPPMRELQQQLTGDHEYAIESQPERRRGYVASAQTRNTQQAQRRSANPNRNHESIEQFSRRRQAATSQARNNHGRNRRKASSGRRFRVSPSTAAGASGSSGDRSDTQRLLPDPQRAGSSREAMAVLAQFVQGVENRRSSGQLLTAHQAPSN